jgi:hypothetical protein
MSARATSAKKAADTTKQVLLAKSLGTSFDIDPARYELLKSAGKGAFGVVWYVEM